MYFSMTIEDLMKPKEYQKFEIMYLPFLTPPSCKSGIHVLISKYVIRNFNS